MLCVIQQIKDQMSLDYVLKENMRSQTLLSRVYHLSQEAIHDGGKMTLTILKLFQVKLHRSQKTVSIKMLLLVLVILAIEHKNGAYQAVKGQVLKRQQHRNQVRNAEWLGMNQNGSR